MSKPTRDDQKRADREFKDACCALDDLAEREKKIAKRTGVEPEEGPEFWKLNQRVIDAEKNASWLARFLR